jgi:hypothetical protein
MSFHISLGDKNFGFLTGPVRFMYTFPDLFSQSVEEVKTLPRTFIPTPDDFESVNELEDDFIALLTYSDTSDSRSIVLLNLKDDSVLYKWTVDNPYQEHDRIWNPLLFPERNLVYSFHGTGLWRIDSLNHVVWKQDSIFAHHSMELDSNGDIWICSYEPVYYATGHYKINGRSVFYKDNCITKIDAETGNILFHKSVTAILRENGLSNYILKSQNILDPLHINDVQPALRSTSYYKEGDVFISARQASFIMHYRPSTNEVLKMIEGPFVCQHDVDFLTDNSLAIFNNNYYEIWTVDSKPAPRDSGRLEIAGDFYSNLVRYDFDTERISFIGDSVFRANRIFTQTEGLMEFVDPSTYFIEEQNSGVIWIIRDDQVIYKNVLKSQHKGYHHLPNWIRIIKQYD